MAQPRSINPNIRYEARKILEDLGAGVAGALGDWLTHNAPSTLMPTCASCLKMEKKGPAFCNKYRMVPPVKVIVGDAKCEGYMDEFDIPF